MVKKRKTAKKTVKRTTMKVGRKTTKTTTQPARRSATEYVYSFGDGKADGDRSMRDLLGGKGAGLAEMTNAGLPVPPGFTITTDACNL